MDSGNKDTQQAQDQTNQQGSSNNPVKSFVEGIKAHSANPGPAIPQDFNVQEEGTKEERRAKAQELNK